VKLNALDKALEYADAA